MSIIFGILTLIASIVLPVLVTIYTGYDILHFTFFFIIPIGAVGVGYLCGFGYFKGLVKSNKYIKKRNYLVGLLLAIICIFGINYSMYSVTCLDETTQEVVYSLNDKENHISTYEMEGYGQLTFVNFTRFMIENTPITFTHNSKSEGDICNPTLGWIFEIISYLGVIAGCLMVGINQKSMPYCHNCKSYKKEKEICKILKIDGSNLFEELDYSLKNPTELTIKDVLNKYKQIEKVKDEHYLCKMVYCDNCKYYTLNFELYEMNRKNNLEQNNTFNMNINVTPEQAQEIMYISTSL